MKLNKKLIMIIIIIILVLSMIVAAVFIFVLKPGKTPPPTAAQLQSWQFPVDKITTNLQGNSIIQIQVTLQATNSAVTGELAARSVQIDDTVIGVLHGMSASTILQPGGRDLIRKQITERVNGYLTSGKVESVYIEDLIIQ